MKTSLDTLCAGLSYAMGIDAPKEAHEKNEALCSYVDSAFGGEKADRILMYNPDAIGDWLYRKYPRHHRYRSAFSDGNALGYPRLLRHYVYGRSA